jgi:hypothetical protein
VTRRLALAAAGLALIAATTACMPKPPPPPAVPPPPPPQYAEPCDKNHLPGNNRSWCMVWIRLKDGAKFNPGPYWLYQFDTGHGGARVIVWPTNWRSAP